MQENHYCKTTLFFKFLLYLIAMIVWNSYRLLVLEQENPSPKVNGDRHVHVKLGLSNPSLVQSALTSHGSYRQGSGTIIKRGKESE